MPFECSQPRLERLEAGDALAQLRPLGGYRLRQIRRRLVAVAVLAPASEFRRLVEWEVESSQVDEQAQPFHIGWAVLAIAVLRTRRPWQDAAALVEAQRVRAHAQVAR